MVLIIDMFSQSYMFNAICNVYMLHHQAKILEKSKKSKKKTTSLIPTLARSSKVMILENVL